jgi:hypothetical protein
MSVAVDYERSSQNKQESVIHAVYSSQTFQRDVEWTRVPQASSR